MTADEERELRAQIAAEVADAPLVPTGGASRRAQRDADLRIIRGTR